MKSVSPGSPLIQSLHRNQDTHKNIKEIYVSVQGVTLDYAAVHALAGKATGDAMMVAWYDGKNQVGYRTCRSAPATSPVGEPTLKATVVSWQ